MNAEQMRQLDIIFNELSKEELFKRVKLAFEVNPKAKKEGLSESEVTRQICLLFFKEIKYEPDDPELLKSELSAFVEKLLPKVKRLLRAHRQDFEKIHGGQMVKEDGTLAEATLWKLRQPELESKEASQREEEKAREEEEQTFKFPFRLREEYPTLAELLEELPATLSEKAAQSIKLNVDEIILFSAMQHGFFHDEAEEAFVKNYAHSLIDSKVSALKSERKTNNDSRIREYTNKFVSLVKS
jgi:hypothetical protein